MNKSLPNRLYSYKTNNRIQRKINYIGSNLNPKVFNLLRILTTLVVFVIILSITKYSYILAPAIAIIYYLLFELILLDSYVIKRNNLLEHDAIEYFQVLIMNNKKYRNLKKSIISTNKIVEDNTIQRLFERVIRSNNAGKSLEESLKDITYIIPSSYINNIIYSIININYNDSSNIEEELKLLYIKDNNRIISKYKLLPLKMSITCIVFVLIYIGFHILLKYIIK